jgi:hypothetical protein
MGIPAPKGIEILIDSAIILLGAIIAAKPSFWSELLFKFYKDYPLVRYAGEKQLRSRNSFMFFLGILLIVLGLLGILSVIY